jgi:hypothetical protein
MEMSRYKKMYHSYISLDTGAYAQICDSTEYHY